MKEFNFKCPPRVALHGVDHTSLLIGRACSLRDEPVVGVHDPDPQKALQASLFLGVSALATPQKLAEQSPRILICTIPLPDPSLIWPDLDLQLNLFPVNSQIDERSCWATPLHELPSAIPCQITSEIPKLRFSLSGSTETLALAKAFLESLGPSFSVEASCNLF